MRKYLLVLVLAVLSGCLAADIYSPSSQEENQGESTPSSRESSVLDLFRSAVDAQILKIDNKLDEALSYKVKDYNSTEGMSLADFLALARNRIEYTNSWKVIEETIGLAVFVLSIATLNSSIISEAMGVLLAYLRFDKYSRRVCDGAWKLLHGAPIKNAITQIKANRVLSLSTVQPSSNFEEASLKNEHQISINLDNQALREVSNNLDNQALREVSNNLDNQALREDVTKLAIFVGKVRFNNVAKLGFIVGFGLPGYNQVILPELSARDLIK